MDAKHTKLLYDIPNSKCGNLFKNGISLLTEKIIKAFECQRGTEKIQFSANVARLLGVTFDLYYVITHIRTLFKSRIPISENLWKLDTENVLKYGFTVLCFVQIENTSSFLGA